jgi:hypothetical protein
MCTAPSSTPRRRPTGASNTIRQNATSTCGWVRENIAHPERWKLSRLPPNSGDSQAASSPVRTTAATAATSTGRTRVQVRSSAAVAMATGRAGRQRSPSRL